MPLALLRRDLRKASSPKRAAINRWFFKTGKGQYGEGDRFIGVTMPDIRLIAKRHQDLSRREIRRLLLSKTHEERMAAVVILTLQYASAPAKTYQFYLANAKRANNWDLVDCSASQIVGEHLMTRPRAILRRLARSRNLWERRIAIVSTQRFIRAGELRDTFYIAAMLMDDPHDLIHKATGWMLREAGKRDLTALRRFLNRHARRMPRTMLRYAIERMSPREREHYLHLYQRRMLLHTQYRQ